MAHSILLTGADRRRFWADEDRRKILTEAFAPGAVTAAVARRYEVSSGLLYTWRRKAQCWENGPRFLRALVDDGGPLAEHPSFHPSLRLLLNCQAVCGLASARRQ